MNGQAITITDATYNGHQVTVECHLSNNLPGIVIVGMANRAIDEARERLRSAFASAKLPLPKKRITINLAPADLPKDGSSYDIAIAAAIMQAGGLIPVDALNGIALIGELSLDGQVRPVRGIIGKLRCAQELGITTAYIPADNSEQAQLMSGLRLCPVQDLHQLFEHLAGLITIAELTTFTTRNHRNKQREVLQKTHTFMSNQPPSGQPDFADVTGQARAKRALEIAAAGHHNILLNGPPGAGKSMLAKAAAGILPAMSLDEIVEVTHLHSLAVTASNEVITRRPFRAPHHSASNTAILGGGATPKPGEISLSHHGVLLLDEFPEFTRETIEALRQPLEDKTITVVRAKAAATFPADFMLIATRNPCPCGYQGSTTPCECSVQDILRYERRLSGPIVDRIDIHLTVDPVDHESLLDGRGDGETSATIQRRVAACRLRQTKRFKTPGKTNATMTNYDLQTVALLEPAAKALLNRAANQLHFSARAYLRCVRVARTIADLADSQTIASSHLAEAIQYRPTERRL